MDNEMQLESDEEMMRRDTVLAEVRNIFIKWVQFVSTEVYNNYNIVYRFIYSLKLCAKLDSSYA